MAEDEETPKLTLAVAELCKKFEADMYELLKQDTEHQLWGLHTKLTQRGYDKETAVQMLMFAMSVSVDSMDGMVEQMKLLRQKLSHLGRLIETDTIFQLLFQMETIVQKEKQSDSKDDDDDEDEENAEQDVDEM